MVGIHENTAWKRKEIRLKIERSRMKGRTLAAARRRRHAADAAAMSARRTLSVAATHLDVKRKLKTFHTAWLDENCSTKVG